MTTQQHNEKTLKGFVSYIMLDLLADNRTSGKQLPARTNAGLTRWQPLRAVFDTRWVDDHHGSAKQSPGQMIGEADQHCL